MLFWVMPVGAAVFTLVPDRIIWQMFFAEQKGLSGRILRTALFLTILKFVRRSAMAQSTITSKGQLTIPKEIREKLGLRAGSKVDFSVLPNGLIVMRAKTKTLDEVAGILKRPGQKALPVELLSR